MSDAPRTEPARTFRDASEPERDAKIEQLLLVGLDHYFAAQYDQAIHVWTRVLFLDRSHARARAYIERARSALAERQRESEERAADDAALARWVALPPPVAGSAVELADRPRPERQPRAEAPVRSGGGWRVATVVTAVLVVVSLAGAAALLAPARVDWPGLLAAFQALPARAAAPLAPEPSLPLPRRGELALDRARALAAEGHLRDALTALDAVRPTDPEKVDADQLRGELQRQLLALTAVPAAPDADAVARGVQHPR